MVESLDSALARIDPIDLVWLIGGVVFGGFMLAVLVSVAVSAVRHRRGARMVDRAAADNPQNITATGSATTPTAAPA